jgi:hypothetical protein
VPQRLRELDGRYVLELHAGDASAPPGEWLALVRAPDGLTVVRPARPTDDGEPWVALFSGETAHAPDVPGMLVALLEPLAKAGVPVMVASTHDADVVLVPAARLAEAAAALRAAGHDVALADG